MRSDSVPLPRLRRSFRALPLFITFVFAALASARQGTANDPPEIVYEGGQPHELAINSSHIIVALKGYGETCQFEPDLETPLLIGVALDDFDDIHTIKSGCTALTHTLIADDSSCYFRGSFGRLERRPAAGGLPTYLYEDSLSPADIAMDATYIYFTDADGTEKRIYRVPKAGGDVETVKVFTTERSIDKFVVNGSNLYWAEGALDSGAIRRMPKSGGAITTLVGPADGIEHSLTLAVDESFVYFGGSESGALRRIPKNGGEIFDYIKNPKAGQWVVSIEVDDNYVFWTDTDGGGAGGADGRVRRLPKDSAAVKDAEVTNLQILALSPSGLSITETHVYWCQSERVYRSRTDSDGVAVDLTLDDIEITQGLQNLRDSDSAPLVRGKTTYVRVYPKVEYGVEEAPWVHADSVTAELRGFRAGAELPESPLKPQTPRVRVTEGANREELDDTFVFVLPDYWTRGVVTFRAEVNPDGAIPEIADGGDNNELETTVFFEEPGPLCLNLVPIDVPGPEDVLTDNQTDYILELARLLWPSASLAATPRDTLHPTIGDFFEIPDDSERILNKLIWLDTMTTLPFGWACNAPGGDTHWVGVVRPYKEDLGLNGASYPSEPYCWFVKYTLGATNLSESQRDYYEEEYGSRLVFPSGPFGAHVLVHELAHGFGRDHVDCGSPDDADDQYPYATDSFGDSTADGYWGFDVRWFGLLDFESWTVLSPSRSRFKDFMSYCDPTWVSDYTYRALLFHQGGVAAGLDEPPLDAKDRVLVISGFGARPDGKDAAKFDRIQVLPAGFFSEEKLARLTQRRNRLTRAGADYVVEQRGVADRVLGSWTFSLDEVADGPGGGGPFFLPVRDRSIPFVLGTAGSVVLLDSRGRELDRREKGQGPKVEVLAPNGGEFFANGFSIDWESMDADSPEITHDVLYSPDGGESWSVLALAVAGTSYSIETPGVVPGSRAPGMSLVRVVANDGFSSSLDDSDGGFTVSNRPPRAHIDRPQDKALLFAGDQVVLRGGAHDVEDGEVDEDALEWRVDGNPAGLGRQIVVDDLGRGRHTARLEAFASGGAGEDEVEFFLVRSPCPMTNRKMDVVFLIEDSPAVAAEEVRVCGIVAGVRGELQRLGLDVRADVLGFPGKRACAPNVVDEDDWLEAIEELLATYAWEDGRTRLVVPVIIAGTSTGAVSKGAAMTPAIERAADAGVAVSPWIIPTANPFPQIASQARMIANETCGKVHAWSTGNSAELIDAALELLEVHAKRACRPKADGILGAELDVRPGRRIVIYGENLWPGTGVKIDGQMVGEIEVSPAGEWIEVVIPEGLEPHRPHDVSVCRPGAGETPVPGSVTPSDPSEVGANRAVDDVLFEDGAIVVRFATQLFPGGEPILDASTDIEVSVNGEIVAKRTRDFVVSTAANFCGNSPGGGCAGSCDALLTCGSSSLGCGCTGLALTSLRHALEDGDEVVVRLSPAPGATQDPFPDDDTQTSVYHAGGRVEFVRGDCNGDGGIDLSDAVADLHFCFNGGNIPCEAACDLDVDGNPCTGVTDGLIVLHFLFQGGMVPPPPFPDCGTAEGKISCQTPPGNCR